jgi:hypothetical protein
VRASSGRLAESGLSHWPGLRGSEPLQAVSECPTQLSALPLPQLYPAKVHDVCRCLLCVLGYSDQAAPFQSEASGITLMASLPVATCQAFQASSGRNGAKSAPLKNYKKVRFGLINVAAVSRVEQKGSSIKLPWRTRRDAARR